MPVTHNIVSLTLEADSAELEEDYELPRAFYTSRELARYTIQRMAIRDMVASEDLERELFFELRET